LEVLEEKVQDQDTDSNKAAGAVKLATDTKQEVERSFKTWKSSFITPVMEFYNQYQARYVKGETLPDRLLSVERGLSRFSKDTNLFGSISLAGVDPSADVNISTIIHRMECLEQENTKLVRWCAT